MLYRKPPTLNNYLPSHFDTAFISTLGKFNFHTRDSHRTATTSANSPCTKALVRGWQWHREHGTRLVNRMLCIFISRNFPQSSKFHEYCLAPTVKRFTSAFHEHRIGSEFHWHCSTIPSNPSMVGGRNKAGQEFQAKSKQRRSSEGYRQCLRL